MVRLKQRYILFEILQPPVLNDADPKSPNHSVFMDYSQNPSNTLLSLHRQTPNSINAKSLVNAIRQSIQEYYGDFGASFALLLNIKYFNNKTSTGIIRCGVQNLQYILGALTMISQIDGKPVIVNCTHVSGTIKKCEQYAIKRDREMMRVVTIERKRERGELNVV